MKLKGSLPAGDLNGLQPAHGQLIKARGKKVLIIGAVTSHEYTDIQDKGKEAKVELVRVEIVPDDLQSYVAELIERALEDRTGQTALDLDIEGATDLRREFKERKAKGGDSPALFTEPAALTSGVGEIVDAEVVDEADENANEGAIVDEERDEDDDDEGQYDQGDDGDDEEDPEGVPFDEWVRRQSESDAAALAGPTPSLGSKADEDPDEDADGNVGPGFSDRPSLSE